MEELHPKSSSIKPKIVRLEQLRGGFNASKPSGTNISAVEGANRIRCIANYLEFHLTRRLGSLTRLSNEGGPLKQVGESVIARLRALTPREGTANEDESLEGLSEDVVEIAERAFHPDSDLNPFSSVFIKQRNYLIWRLLLETGMRRGELRHIKIEDVDYSHHQVKIMVSKTIRRTVPTSTLFSAIFHSFITQHLSRIPAKQRSHNYLLTTAKGKHLSLDAINLIFREIRRKVHGLPKFIAPHALRRTWNDRLSAKIDAQPESSRMPPEQELQVRNRLQGWKKNSLMGGRYSKRHIRLQADKIGEELANEITSWNENNEQ